MTKISAYHMPRLRKQSLYHPLLALGFFALLLTIAGFIACGSDEAASPVEVFPQISETSRQYDVDALKAIGFKVGREYDVEGLTGALSAVNGFRRIDGVAAEFEARFYQSHDDAVQLGTSFALEGSGETAALSSSDAMWAEGVRDRRTVFDYRSTPQARYGAYIIRSNMILLCEGKDAAQSIARCQAFMSALEPT